jgi:FixJ family two-component response regulator
MRRGYDPGYGSREQLKDCVEQGMKAARERDALKTENAALLDRINKLTWQSEQYKTLLVCMRHFMNCDGANECRTCVVTADMYLELMT